MQLLGAHISIAGGVQNAIERGERLGCTAIQIFVKQPQKLFDKEPTEKNIASWHKKLSESGIIETVIAHAGYLINLASPEDEKWQAYTEALIDEMARCDRLKIGNLVLHPGSPHDMGELWGIKRIARAIDRIYESGDFTVDIALETTAGTGNQIGSRFENFYDIFNRSKFPDKLRVCFDTCHVFTAGYKFTTPDDYTKMWRDFDETIGIEQLAAMHLNDSKYPFDSHRDRHEHIGKGFMGNEPFRLIMQDEKLKSIPKIIETPNEDDWDMKNLQLLWELSGEKPPVIYNR